MNWLELRVPPIVLVAATALLMWIVSTIAPAVAVGNSTRIGLVVLFIFVGLSVVASGVVAFRKTETTVDPTKPGAATSLVTSGVYRRTRNPMYVGMCLLLIAWGIFLSSIPATVLVFVFVLYLNRFQIEPEERVLEKTFGQEFSGYKSQVRRWI